MTHSVFLGCFDRTPWMSGFLDELATALLELGPRYVPARSASEADIIFYVAPGYNRFRDWIRRLDEERNIALFPEKCFVYDFSDRPVTFLPGLYTSLSRGRIDAGWARSADRWTRVAERALVENDLAMPPSLLFSFRGFASADVRRRLFSFDFGRSDVAITRTERWWDYSEGEPARVQYLKEMAASAFVLCPRGLAPSTYRLYEAMELGRAPVILADDWVPPAGPPWDDFSVRLPEARADALPEILEPLRKDAAEMGRAARTAWERWMQPGPALLSRWLEAVDEMLLERRERRNRSDLASYWRSASFQWENQIHPIQGVRDAVRTGTLRARTMDRLKRRTRK